MINWDARLLQIAEEHPDASGRAGELLRARLAQQAIHGLTHDLHLAHARAREAVVTGTRMALRCGALLLKAPAGEVATLMRVAGITPQAGEHYMHMALGHPELARISAKRFGRISEAQALHLLWGEQSDGLADPVTDLMSLHELQS
ncbi:MAG: hypothetical protein P4L96_13475 [Rhodoferax sp.]|nr:hypothetical protein [Rhodoferax sp.]